MTSNKLLSIISRLCGPDIAHEEIEWVTDLPAGKQLVEWLESQIVEHSGAETDHNEMVWVAWKDIALEKDEASSIRAAEAFGLVPLAKPARSEYPGYTLPSEMKLRTKTMEMESQLIEDEIKLLKSRLQQTKIAAQNALETLQTLEHTLDTTRSDISQKQEKLGELSIDADISLSLSTGAALRILDTLNFNSNQTHQKEQASSADPKLHEELSALASLRSQIINETDIQMNLVNEARASLPKLQEVSREAARLHYAFNGHTDTPTRDDEPKKLKLTQAAEDAAYSEELNKIYERLEMGGAIEDLLNDDSDDVEVELDTQNILAQAWACDQAGILAAHVEVLEKAIYAFKQHLKPPLSNFCSLLSNSDAQISEAEALMGALIEELDSIMDDVHEGKQRRKTSAKPETNMPQLDKQLKHILKRLEGLRSADADPLVLLDQADLIRELSSSVARATHVNHMQERWMTNLPKQLSYLSATHSQLLATIYSNSPVNTSPPFAPPQNVLALEADARDKADTLQKDIVRLQKESIMTSKTNRKADVFIQKWSKS